MPKSDLALAGGDYAPVAERITLFYERFPEGRIITELVSQLDGQVTFRASVYRAQHDPEPAATGWATEREGDGEVNAVACLENTETSAIGRALANLGFTASGQRPSREEMAKAARARARLAGHASLLGASVPTPAAVREPTPGTPAAALAAVPPDAPLRVDGLVLLAEAEREGLRPARAAAARRLFNRTDATIAELEAAERGLRDWLARRDRRPRDA